VLPLLKLCSFKYMLHSSFHNTEAVCSLVIAASQYFNQATLLLTVGKKKNTTTLGWRSFAKDYVWINVFEFSFPHNHDMSLIWKNILSIQHIPVFSITKLPTLCYRYCWSFYTHYVNWILCNLWLWVMMQGVVLQLCIWLTGVRSRNMLHFILFSFFNLFSSYHLNSPKQGPS